MGSLGGLSPGGSIALGIIVGLVSTSVQSLGLTLQRKSHILEDEKDPLDVRRPPHRRRRWQLGMGLFIVSNVLGSTVQISMLPLPVLSTLQASGLVFNSLCATLILGEPFTRWSLSGTVLVCTGAVLIAVFGAIPSPAHALDELLALLGRRSFVLWMSFQAVIVVAIAASVDLVHRLTKLSQNVRFRFCRGLAYGTISGILSAHALLVAKSAVELVVRTIADRDNQFVRWQSWMLVVGLVVLALTQLYYLHRGLKLVSTSVLYPLVFCVYNIIAILDGLIYFHQTSLISPLRACLIALGTVILLSGVLALSWRLSEEQHQPAVGQSSLAPGLGLVEDTEGEDEVEELLLASNVGDDEDAADAHPAHYSYDTFGPAAATENGGVRDEISTSPPPLRLTKRKKSLAASAKRPSSLWTESAEIWGELEDRDPPDSPLLPNRRWSSTFPAVQGEAAPLLHARRGAGGLAPVSSDGAGVGGAGDQPVTPSPGRRGFRRRRKSTGFPGFTARKSERRKNSSVLQDTLAGLWRLRWWQQQQQPQTPQTQQNPPDSSTTPSRRISAYGDSGEDPENAGARAGAADRPGSIDSSPSQRTRRGRGESKRHGSWSSRGRDPDDDSPV